MTGNRIKLAVAGFLAVAAITGSAAYLLWCSGAFLPGWVLWQNRVSFDSSAAYQLTLADKSVEIRCQDTLIWTSPKKVKVQDALFSDIDKDGEDELILLCWKVGRYGKYRPFWVTEDEDTWSQHIFVYECTGDTIHAKWMSSYIGQEVTEIASDETRPPFSRLLLTDPEGKLSCWHWDSWGFTREETEVSFVVFGDNLIHEAIYRYGLQQDPTFGFLYRNLKECLAKADVAVINQETPLVEDPGLYGDYPRFGTPANVGNAIADAGFDVVTCATNHALDRGMEGLSFTRELFLARDILCLGTQTKSETDYIPYELLTRNQIRFALLNYTYGTNGMPLPEEHPYAVHLFTGKEQIQADIAAAKEASDFVIVFAHWGTEYEKDPDDFQETWARIFLDAGVDVVVGTHPHALQPFEILEDEQGHKMLIYYSIGNYISSQKEPSCVKGGMAHFTVSLTQEGYQLTDYGLDPLVITRQEDGRYEVDFQ